MCVFVSVLGSVPVSAGIFGGQPEFPELELQVVVSLHVGSGNRTLRLWDIVNNTLMNSGHTYFSTRFNYLGVERVKLFGFMKSLYISS